MRTVEVILYLWLVGWFISLIAYVTSVIIKSKHTGTEWLLKQSLYIVPMLLFSWLVVMIVYIYFKVKYKHINQRKKCQILIYEWLLQFKVEIFSGEKV
jgi:hypothetical protein